MLAGDVGTAVINNGRTMTVAVNAAATADGDADALAAAGGMAQIVEAADGFAQITNGGSLTVSAIANATAGDAITAEGDLAVANATALAGGVFQDAGGGTASFANGGTFSVTASANAAGDMEANASAVAVGVFQLGGALNVFTNEGVFNVSANAVADGPAGDAEASALGLGVTGRQLTLDVVNDGEMTVTANAEAPEAATAQAVGMAFVAFVPPLEPPVEGDPVPAPVEEARIDGTAVNSGNLTVTATADGGEVMVGDAGSCSGQRGLRNRHLHGVGHQHRRGGE